MGARSAARVRLEAALAVRRRTTAAVERALLRRAVATVRSAELRSRESRPPLAQLISRAAKAAGQRGRCASSSLMQPSPLI